MRVIAVFVLTMSWTIAVSGVELGCQNPAGFYESREGAELSITDDLKIEVLDNEGKKIFIGEISNFDKFKLSKYNNYANSPEIHSSDQSLASWAVMHIGENCLGIKMGWFLGERRGKRKMVGKYYFEKNT